MQNLYPLFRPLLFAADPELAHDLVLRALDAAARAGLAPRAAAAPAATPVTVMGIRFPNRVGLAAGLDKNAAHLRGLATLGFGFLEAGTVTPRPQPGNPRPRMFRLPAAQAIVNRLGFNNEGVAHFVANVARSGYRGILGVNIGKNSDTPNERAADDYIACLRAVHAVASYVTINVSSPNTRGLRDLQAEQALDALLLRIVKERDEIAQRQGRRVPLVVKIAPDLAEDGVAAAARLLIRHRIDGVIATNTTLARDGVEGLAHAGEAGGLSGAPLRARAMATLRTLVSTLDGALPIIGVGGILSGDEACERTAAGAALVQLYTGLIYRGPRLVGDCVRALADADPRASAA
ncbi:MAG TPA: quinone-dependent dihydroorotate dehydrogenase [Casimicrobiaceae bacterium]|nr:quinone-dependent dihydroorotate dehydrogenase [Casimicrobiaceae bacterium]